MGKTYRAGAPVTWARINRKFEWLGWFQVMIAFIITVYYLAIVIWVISYIGVLIAKDGNSALDTVCTVDYPLDVVLLSSVAILRPDPKCLDSFFLKFYLSSPETIDYLKSNFISGEIPRVVLRDFYGRRFGFPVWMFKDGLLGFIGDKALRVRI